MCCSAVQSVYGVEGLGGRQSGWGGVWGGWSLRKCCCSHFQSCYEHMQGRELLNRRINRSLTLDLHNAVVRRSQSSELHWNLFFWPPHNLLCAISLISISTALALIIFKQHKVRYCWSVHFFSSPSGEADTQMSQSAAAPRAQGCASPASAAEFRPALWSCCCCCCDIWIHCEIMFIFLPPLPWKCMNLCRTVRRCWARGAKKLVDCLKEWICLFGKRPPTISDSDGQWNSCFFACFSFEFISSLRLMIMCAIIIQFIVY